MSAIDRSDDLIRAMLQRRADAPMPPWLAARVRETLAATTQTRSGRVARWRTPLRRGGRLSLAAAVIAILAAASIGVLLAANIIDIGPTPKPTLPAVVVAPSASPEALPSTRPRKPGHADRRARTDPRLREAGERHDRGRHEGRRRPACSHGARCRRRFRRSWSHS